MSWGFPESNTKKNMVQMDLSKHKDTIQQDLKRS